LEDRIRELCAKAVVTDEPAELNELLAQLTAALHEQVDQIRKRVMQDKLAPERRFSRT
jgi:homoserine kinase